MKYLLLICWDESTVQTPEEQAEMERDTVAWAADVDDRKVRIMGQRLEGVHGAKSVRVRGGKTSIQDGPFAETKEQFVGFDILDCAGLEEAIEIASRHPVAKVGVVEVRRFWEG